MEKAKATIGTAKYLTDIQAENNSILADEKIEKGGQAKGFTPTELLASSLAACTSITLRMYADRKEWDLQGVEVEVMIETNNGTALFNRNIHLKGTLDNEQTERLKDIANKCPVHKILSGNIQIKTELV